MAQFIAPCQCSERRCWASQFPPHCIITNEPPQLASVRGENFVVPCPSACHISPHFDNMACHWLPRTFGIYIYVYQLNLPCAWKALHREICPHRSVISEHMIRAYCSHRSPLGRLIPTVPAPRILPSTLRWVDFLIAQVNHHSKDLRPPNAMLDSCFSGLRSFVMEPPRIIYEGLAAVSNCSEGSH
jgi:hypothetical protein